MHDRSVRTRLSFLLVPAILLLSACVATPSSRNSNSAGERTPGGLMALQDRADQAYAEGRLLDAEQLYRLMLKEMPQSAHAWLRLGNVQLRNSELEAAARSFRECLKFQQQDGRCWNNLALTYIKMAHSTLDQSAGFVVDAEQLERLEAFRRRVVESTASQVTEAR
jgi:Tfp pilus assembly protein PilF